MNTTTNTTSKLTYASVCSDILENYAFPTPESKEKFEALIASLTRKSENKGERKPTAKQVENVGIYANIKSVLADGGQMTIGAIVKALGNDDLSGQRVAAIIRPYLGTEILREEVKGKAYFALAE